MNLEAYKKKRRETHREVVTPVTKEIKEKQKRPFNNLTDNWRDGWEPFRSVKNVKYGELCYPEAVKEKVSSDED